MTDRELLGLAAKAAGIAHHGYCSDGFLFTGDGESGAYTRWNPLTDDGDALRLAVKLEMEIRNLKSVIGAATPNAQHACVEHAYAADGTHSPEAATRRAITRAAAEIGKAMK